MSDKIEIWKDIPGYEGLYQASTEGRVKNIKRNSILRPSYKKEKTVNNHKILPYRSLNLYKDGKIKHWFVHRLVLLTFEGPIPPNCQVVMHNDDDPSNNALLNLKYGTHSENSLEAYRKKRSKPQGVREGMKRHAELKKRKLIVVNSATNEETHFGSLREGARFLNIPSGCIVNIMKGRRKNRFEYTFKYAS